MFNNILEQFRHCVREHRYVLTVHAEEEMDEDRLTIFDIEHGVLTGKIIERQKDAITGEFKYRVRGRTVNGLTVEILMKPGANDKAVIITVYVL